LTKKFEADGVQSKVNELKQKNRFTSEADVFSLQQDAERLAITDFILKHISQSSATSLGFEVNLDDTANINPLLSDCPVDVVPIEVHREQKKGSIKMFYATTAELNEDNKEIIAATQKAENFLNLIFDGKFKFDRAIQIFKQRSDHMSLPRQRWMVAGRRIILKVKVAKVILKIKEMPRILEIMEANKKSK
jgi:hypothetical protein